jgi:hypothetical protein
VVPGPASQQSKVQVQAYYATDTTEGTSEQYETYGPPTSISFTSPTAGTKWRAGSQQTITWTGGTDAVDSSVIYYSLDGGVSWARHGPSLTPGSYHWTVPDTTTKTAQVRVRAYYIADSTIATSAQYEIYHPPSAIEVTSPSDTSRWLVGSSKTLTWNGGTNPMDSTFIFYSTDGGGNWTRYGPLTGPGRCDWTVPGPPSRNAVVQVRAYYATDTTKGASAEYETYVKPTSITVTSPAAGVRWQVGSAHTVAWEGGTDHTDSTIVDYSTDAGSNWTRQGRATTGGSFEWTVPGPACEHGKLRVRAYYVAENAYGESDEFRTYDMDVGVTSILAPPSDVDSGDVVPPAAVVRNYGSTPVAFEVVFRIGGFYACTRRVNGLNAGETTTVSFDTWPTILPGTQAVSCSTMLDGDIVPDNDRLTGTVEVAKAPSLAVGFYSFPNPLRHRGADGSTTIRFLALRPLESAEITVYNTAGEIVFRKSVPAGQLATRGAVHHVPWDGRDGHGRMLATGVYLAQLRAVSRDGSLERFRRTRIAIQAGP